MTELLDAVESHGLEPADPRRPWPRKPPLRRRRSLPTNTPRRRTSAWRSRFLPRQRSPWHPPRPRGAARAAAQHAVDDVIRVDEQGRKWYQEEVRKPAYPKPRGRRVLKYIETGVAHRDRQERRVRRDVRGRRRRALARPAEVKITLPSYQVGIYKDPRFPFKIHCYDGREGFDLFEVQKYYGGSELVPDEMQAASTSRTTSATTSASVIRTIQNEHRQMQLTGRIK